MVEQKVKDAMDTLRMYVHDSENECEECKHSDTQCLDRVSALVLKVKELEKENEGLKERNSALTTQIKRNITAYQALFPEEIKIELPIICPYGHEFGRDREGYMICCDCDLNKKCGEERGGGKIK